MAATYAFDTAATSSTICANSTLTVVRRTGTDSVTCIVTCTMTPRRPTEVAMAAKRGSEPEKSRTEPSANTTCADTTCCDSDPCCSEEPWVAVEMAPAIVWSVYQGKAGRVQPLGDAPFVH